MTAYLTATCEQCANLDRTQDDGVDTTHPCLATPARHHQYPRNRACAAFVELAPAIVRETGSAGDSPSVEQLDAMVADPRYWRDRDPDFIASVSEGFSRLYRG